MNGGEFLIKATPSNSVFIPEEWSEEQILMANSVLDFINKEVHPNLDILDAQEDPFLMPALLEKAADFGLAGVTVPIEYGGTGMDFNTALLFGEVCSSGHCFATTLGAQTSIGSLPILYYGTDEQKKKYLPGIASGKIKASYCLTEPGAGSDANSAKTKATFSKTGDRYLLNGQKMWITNGGFANLFIVFAKIEDDKNLSAFIVEKEFGGIDIGAEEKKLGIKGSSTVQVFFNNCPVPLENLLGERDGGFKIALNTLNSGRAKLAAGAIGGSKFAADVSVRYANQRHQFGKSIGEFGAIKHKLASMAVRTFASESALYRIGHAIDKRCQEHELNGDVHHLSMIKAIKEYVIECSLLKVHGSEVVDFCVDETLQIHGGMGFSAESGVERAYRDARITRIYEGTNEINRLLSVGELFKIGFKEKKIDLINPLKKIPGQIFTELLPFNRKKNFSREDRVINNLKSTFLILSANVARKFGAALDDEQEILMCLSDILAEVLVTESVWLRIKKLESQDDEATKKMNSIKRRMAEVYTYEALQKIRNKGKEIIRSYASGFKKHSQIATLILLTREYDANPKELRRMIANYMLEKDTYPFNDYNLKTNISSQKVNKVST